MRSGEEAEELRASEWHRLQELAKLRTVRWIREQALKWRRLRRTESRETTGAIESIRAVEQAYNEFMRLKAPADYWRGKAASHKVAEGEAKKALYWFFPLAVLTILVVFGAVGTGLILSPSDPGTAVYVVASAGLATFAGMIFWVGRLLTRLYLSEHHLRKDAEEREVMTTTYLALTKEQAAEEADRSIILTALFRNSSDGIVKDDGVTDTSAAALLARLGMPR